ncbi:hypothetical protein CEE45_13275 [Candidatus Heimdallarchaeota archaeon B3_Heim]|nr:MAG: hypothetical protein CEE45_13275 [Candidatus Heimdallarchaeota archaeon B3_Heim]
MNQTILGFFGQKNQWTHDHSAAICIDDSINTYIQLERISRRKHDNDMPNQLSKILLDLEVDIGDLEIGYANTFSLESKDFFKHSDNNILSTNNEVEFRNDGTNTLEPVKIPGRILDQKVTAIVVPHELAHIFSLIPFYGKFNNNSLLVHVDGAASVSNATAWYFQNNHIELLEHTTVFHHALLNFSYNDLTFDILKINRLHHFSMPGKLMGFASYGSGSDELLSWLRSRDFFRDYNEFSQDQFIQEAKDLFGYDKDTIIQDHQMNFNIAACMQKHFEEKIFNFIQKHQHNTDAKFLYYAGGAALNIKLNSVIINSRLFDEVSIPPPAGDSGLSLGVVAFLYWKRGNEISNSLNPYLNNYGLERESYSPNYSIDKVCKDLSKGAVIGVCWGDAEAGPRALGHRSILANPCLKHMKDLVSMQIKKREWYRPLAPVVLESELENLFQDYICSQLMNYMLYEFQVKEQIREKIPAVIHCDGTSRAQVVPDENVEQRMLIDILKTMRDDFDIPCLINTSFNMAGEPIVHTKQDALNSAQNLGLDGVILGNEYITLR